MSQCSAKSSQTGKRCKRHSIRGGSVCATHGGRAPQVQEAARRRLALLVDPAIGRLEKTIKDGTSEAAAIRAAMDILDRVGLKPTDRIEVETTDTSEAALLADIFTTEELKDFRDRIRAKTAKR